METGKYKAVIIYYSLEGNTKEVANYISRKFNIHSIEVVSKKTYPKHGPKKYLVGGYDVIKKYTPRIEEINIEDYDVVFLGSPIWAGTFAPPIRTLIKSGKLQGKNIHYFYTHKGGAMNASNKIEECDLNIVSTLSIANVSSNMADIKPLVINWVSEIVNREER